jgi:tripartite-type tricarboxylate transporter receptor subunit TctC
MNPQSVRRALATAPLCACLCAAAIAQSPPAFSSYPSKPIRFISFGGSDAVPRILGQRITENLGVQVINETRGGASGTLGAELVARAPADGYTIAIGTSSLMTAPHFYKVSYDVVRDFAPVSLVAFTPWILATNPSLPVKSVRELIALAKARPGELNYGGPSAGSSGHLIVEMFKVMAAVNIVHVPYKTQAAQIVDLIGGQVPIGIMVAPLVIPQMNANKLRGLAVTTAKRSLIVPELPTIAEAGVPGFAAPGWYALLAPAGTPPAVINVLNGEVTKALKHPEVLALFATLALEPVGTTPQELGSYISVELAKWARVIKDANIKVDPSGLPL